MDQNKFWDEVGVLLSSSLNTLSKSIYDEFIKINASKRNEVGITCKIVRKAHGETCDWCRELIGVYKYGEEPPEVYQRHNHCDCTVEYFSEKGRQDVWSKSYLEENEYKKKERVAYMIGNTIEPSNQIQLINSYKNNINDRLEDDEKYKAFKRIAKANNERVLDATDYWMTNRSETGIVVKNDKVFFFKGEKYHVDGYFIEYDPSEREEEVAEILKRVFGGTIELNPKISYPENIRVADYCFNGELMELKTLDKFSKSTIYDAINKNKDQANSFIIDISKISTKKVEILDNIEKHLHSDHLKKIKNVLVIDGNDVIKVYERI